MEPEAFGYAPPQPTIPVCVLDAFEGYVALLHEQLVMVAASREWQKVPDWEEYLVQYLFAEIENLTETSPCLTPESIQMGNFQSGRSGQTFN